MRRLLLGAFLAVGLSGPTVAQELFPLQQVPSSGGSCTPSGSPCPVGITAPAGYHFDLVYDDEFQSDSTLNTSLWTCGSSPCTDYPDQVYLNSDGLNLSSTISTPGCTGNSGCSSGIGSVFTPRFGVWEWSTRYPRGYDGSGDGYHMDVYYNNNSDTDRTSYQEVSLGETILGTSSDNIANMYCCVSGSTVTVNENFNINSPTRFSDDFHIFSSMWFNDGTGNGAVSNYLDGGAIFTGGRQGDGWGSGGASVIMEEVNCFTSSQIYDNGNACSSSTAASGNPITFKYFRYWQIVAN